MLAAVAAEEMKFSYLNCFSHFRFHAQVLRTILPASFSIPPTLNTEEKTFFR